MNKYRQNVTKVLKLTLKISANSFLVNIESTSSSPAFLSLIQPKLSPLTSQKTVSWLSSLSASSINAIAAVLRCSQRPKIYRLTTRPKIYRLTTRPKIYRLTTRPKIYRLTIRPKIYRLTIRPKIYRLIITIQK